jgi:hypothetical protein
MPTAPPSSPFWADWQFWTAIGGLVLGSGVVAAVIGWIRGWWPMKVTFGQPVLERTGSSAHLFLPVTNERREAAFAGRIIAGTGDLAVGEELSAGWARWEMGRGDHWYRLSRKETDHLEIAAYGVNWGAAQFECFIMLIRPATASRVAHFRGPDQEAVIRQAVDIEVAVNGRNHRGEGRATLRLGLAFATAGGVEGLVPTVSLVKVTGNARMASS